MPGDEILQIARVLTGEASILGWPGMLAVAYTILCRLESGRYGEDLSYILQAYNGDQPPTDEALILARILVERPEQIRELWIRRFQDSRWFYYVMSRDDVALLGWPPAERMISSRVEPHTLNLYSRWQ